VHPEAQSSAGRAFGTKNARSGCGEAIERQKGSRAGLTARQTQADKSAAAVNAIYTQSCVKKWLLLLLP
jgi:hypothetical protein